MCVGGWTEPVQCISINGKDCISWQMKEIFMFSFVRNVLQIPHSISSVDSSQFSNIPSVCSDCRLQCRLVRWPRSETSAGHC